MKRYIFLSLVLLISYSISAEPSHARITVQTNGVRGVQGIIQAYLFRGKEGFPDKPDFAFKTFEVPADGFTSSVTFDDLPLGTYAVVLIHDENGNRMMDTNWLGIPTEGYGISNNATGFMGPPVFNDAAFEVDSQEKQILIDFIY